MAGTRILLKERKNNLCLGNVLMSHLIGKYRSGKKKKKRTKGGLNWCG